jgi:hypothetical protein
MSIIEAKEIKKTKKTYAEISAFTRLAHARLKTSDLSKENKLILHICDLIGNPLTGEVGSLKLVQEQYNKDLRKLQRKHASVDEKGNLLKNSEGGYVFTKEKEAICDQEIEQLNHKLIEIEPSFCALSDIPDGFLLPSEKNAYIGFVIDFEKF